MLEYMHDSRDERVTQAAGRTSIAPGRGSDARHGSCDPGHMAVELAEFDDLIDVTAQIAAQLGAQLGRDELPQ